MKCFFNTTTVPTHEMFFFAGPHLVVVYVCQSSFLSILSVRAGWKRSSISSQKQHHSEYSSVHQLCCSCPHALWSTSVNSVRVERGCQAGTHRKGLVELWCATRKHVSMGQQRNGACFFVACPRSVFYFRHVTHLGFPTIGCPRRLLLCLRFPVPEKGQSNEDRSSRRAGWSATSSGIPRLPPTSCSLQTTPVFW